MSSHTFTRVDHRSFCETEGWTLRRQVDHHATYTFAHPDGRLLRTRISRPVKKTMYGASMAAHVLRDQLEVTIDEFWACARDGVRPQRGRSERPAATLPAGLLFTLRRELGLSDEELAAINKDDAVHLLNEHWTESGDNAPGA